MLHKARRPYQINEKKVRFSSKKRRVRITGLVIDCKNDISIGRSKKREIKALIHKFRITGLDTQQTSYLKGYISYINGVEPKFVRALEDKYGKELLNTILQA